MALFPVNSPTPSDGDRIIGILNATADIAAKNAAFGWSLLYDGKTMEESQGVYAELGTNGAKVNLCNAVLGVALNVIQRRLAGYDITDAESAFLTAVETLLPELDAQPVKLVSPYTITDGADGSATLSAKV